MLKRSSRALNPLSKPRSRPQTTLLSTTTATRVAELATRIQQGTSRIDEYLQKKHLPAPSFDEDGPVELGLTGDLATTRIEVIDASLELHQLLLGPSSCLRPTCNGVALQAIYKYNIAARVPRHGDISFVELAEQTGLSETNIRRMLRYAMTFHRVFQEPRRGYVAHTAVSRRLVDDPHAMAGLGYMFDEVWQGFAHTIPALEEFHSDEPNKTGWAHYHKTDKPAWEYYAEHPDMARRFASAMSSFANGHGNSPSFLVQGYPWDEVGNGRVVDVGGSKGKISMLLAQQYPDLKCTVQDLPEMIADAAEKLPSDLQGRIDFQAYDFFTPQTKQADLYLFRNIFHNWSDSHAVKILKALTNALQPGAKIVINEYLLPEPGTMAPMTERTVREMDMVMLTLFNAREREEADWVSLIEGADSRFKDIKIWTPDGATMAIIEMTWSG